MSAVGGRISPNGYVVIDPNALRRYVQQGGGPVMADLMRRATNVQGRARHLVGKDTRRLERSIVKRPGIDGKGPYVEVVTEGVTYALHHHNGTDRWGGNPFLLNALNEEGGGAPSSGREMVQYTTRSGHTRMATRAQVDNWTRGAR